jgi:hypothetical protein
VKKIPLRVRSGAVVAYALVDDTLSEWLNGWSWCLGRDSAVVRTESYRRADGVKTSRTIRMARQIMGFPGCMVDHWDRNPLNNQRHNLRLATSGLNQQNTVASSRSVSGFRGVGVTKNGRWQARGCVDGQRTHLGTFVVPEEAARVAEAWRAEHMPYSPEANPATGGSV